VLIWTGGTLSGTGRTLARGGLFLGGSPTKMLIGHTLTNAGKAVWSGTGDLVGSNNALFENLADATLDVLGGASFRTTSGATFNNAGTLQKTDGAVTTVEAQLNNAGGVDIQVGRLNLTGGGQSGGTFTVADSGTLGFAGGRHTLSSPSTITGAGTVIFGGSVGAATTVLGTYDLSGPTVVSGGTVNFIRDVTLSALTLSGGALAGFGDVTANGLLSWTCGTMSGLGRTLAAGGMAISGSAAKFLDGRTLVNEATATWEGGSITASNAAIWDNQPGALFDVRTDASFVANFGPRFDNAGTVRKSAGTGTATLGPLFNNSGNVDVQTGTLSLSGGGLSSGVFTSEMGATLNFAGGTQTLTTASTIHGAGDVLFGRGSTTNVTGVYNLAGTTRTAGGVVNFNSSEITIGTALAITDGTANFTSPILVTLPALNLSAGGLTGTSDVLVTGTFTWAGGGLRGPGRITAADSLAISGGGTLDGRTLDNPGSATWTGNGGISVANGGYFNNLAGATLTIQGDVFMQLYDGTGGFRNAGTVRKVNSGGSTFLPLVDNVGTVDVQSGTLRLGGFGGMSSGTITVAAGTTLDVAIGGIGGVFTFTATSRITGAGSVIFTNSLGTVNVVGVFTVGSTGVGPYDVGGPVNFTGSVIDLGNSLTVGGGVANFSGPTSITVPQFSLLTGGTLTGTSNLVVTGQTTWNAGTMSGTGHTMALGGMVIGSDPVFGKLLDGRTVDSGGNTTWAGSTDILIRNSAVWNNLAQGTFDVRADVSFSLGSGGGSFNNLGTFVKSAGSGITRVPIVFNNSGSLRVRSGALNLSSGGLASGSFLVDQGAVLTFEGGSHTLSNTAVVEGAGAVRFSGSLGIANVAGRYDIEGSTSVFAGTVNFTGRVIGLGNALFVSGGTANFSSPDAVNVPTLTLSDGVLMGTSDIRVMTGTLTWTGGAMRGTGRTSANGGVTISGSSAKELSRPLDNLATATWAGTGAIRSSAGIWTNLPAARLIIQNDADFDAVLENQGTIRKQDSNGRTNFSWIFESSGTVDVASGTLSVGFGGTSSGSFTVAAGATLEIGRDGVHTFTSTSEITGAGNVVVNYFFGGVVNVAGLFNISGTTVIGSVNGVGGTIHFTNPVIHVGTALTLSAGTADFSGPAVLAVPALTLNHGFTAFDATLTGTSEIVIIGLLTWNGGGMRGPGRTVAQGGISISGSEAKYLDGRTLDNPATATWTGTGNINVGNGAVWNNLAGATFDVQTDASMSVFFSGTFQPPVFNNAGLFRKSAGTGTTGIYAQFNNSGAANVQSGTVSLSLPGSDSSGSFTVEQGATLEFAAGTHVLRPSSSITGAGTVRFGSDFFGRGTTTILGTYNVGATLINSGTVTFINDAVLSMLTLSGGTLASFGDVTVTGSLTWAGGVISGPGRTIPSGGLAISGGNHGLDGAVLDNTATATWNGTGNINLSNGAVLNNRDGATFIVTGNSLMTTVAGLPAAFHNAGTFVESAPGGTTTIQVAFDNSGVVEVSGGTLRLTGPFLNFSDATGELAGGTYVVAGTFQFPNAHVVSNAATIVLDGTDARIINQVGADALAGLTDNSADGSLTIQNGRDLSVGAFDNRGQLTVGPGSHFLTAGAYLQTDGATVLESGDLAAVGGVDLEGGTLSGSGTVDADVTNSGLVQPGGDGSTGTLVINGNYTQTAAGVLHMDLGGLMPGLEYDQLLINGAALLDGELDVGEINGFVPQAGDNFRILTFATRNGDFATTSGLDLGEGLVLDLVYHADGLTLQARQT
jgi:hypothetical protein